MLEMNFLSINKVVCVKHNVLPYVTPPKFAGVFFERPMENSNLSMY